MMLRTVMLPVTALADWTTLTWPDRNVLEVFRYAVDATAWLTDSGDVIANVAVSEAGTLVVSPVEFVLTDGVITGWRVKIGGGTANSSSSVRFNVALARGGTLIVDVALHTRVDPGLPYVPVASLGPAAQGVITLSGQIVTIDGLIITIGGV